MKPTRPSLPTKFLIGLALIAAFVATFLLGWFGGRWSVPKEDLQLAFVPPPAVAVEFEGLEILGDEGSALFRSELEVPISFVEPPPSENESRYPKHIPRREPGQRVAITTSPRLYHKREQAVLAALNWLAAHQDEDGGWSFDHRLPSCLVGCTHPGTDVESRMRATSLALLTFLHAGYTHRSGSHKQIVEKGLKFLLQQRTVHQADPMRVRFAPVGDADGHALATLVLCESYAQHQEEKLVPICQSAINEIVATQDPQTGNWTNDGPAADPHATFVWNLSALRVAHMAYLTVPPKSVKGLQQFLNSPGGFEASGSATRAAAPGSPVILTQCRLWLGVKPIEPAIRGGLEKLSNSGVHRDDLTYTFLATQCIHAGRDEKQIAAWEDDVSDWLIDSQTEQEHDAGSWYFAEDPHAISGGRLHCTALAALILEWRYMHHPLLQPPLSPSVADDDFPL